ncbi:MAG: MerR family transcriptional regulator [Alphaproteobacteria bacterium]|nr:MerR family transcriptional regulator [Alphaproteobacteria bacterium]
MESEYFASINEVSKQLGLPAHTLRYWEKQFPSVVRPTTGAGGRRYYRAETVERLRTIQDLLYNRGMTIAGVRKMIYNGEFVTSPDVATIINTEPPVEPVIQEMPKVVQRTETAVSGPAALDRTKVDLAIGLLNQAKDILKS